MVNIFKGIVLRPESTVETYMGSGEGTWGGPGGFGVSSGWLGPGMYSVTIRVGGPGGYYQQWSDYGPWKENFGKWMDNFDNWMDRFMGGMGNWMDRMGDWMGDMGNWMGGMGNWMGQFMGGPFPLVALWVDLVVLPDTDPMVAQAEDQPVGRIAVVAVELRSSPVDQMLKTIRIQDTYHEEPMNRLNLFS